MTDRPRENGCTADTQAISDLLERIGAIQNNPDYIANDLVMQLHEIKTMADKGMYPRSIAMVCRSAARTADKLAQATGNAAFTDTAESLRFMAQNYCPFLSHTNNDPGVEIIYTATGGEYIMPDELEEYRKDNPVGAAMWEEQNQKAQEVQQLTFNIDPDPLDPKLDPRSPDFDPAAWKIAMEELQGTATERMQQAMDKVQKHIFGALDTQNAQYIEVTGAMAESVTSIARNAMAGITAFINSDVYHAVKESMQILRDFVEENRDLFEAAADAAEEIKPLVPFLQQELDEMAKDPKYAHATLDDLLERGFDELGNATESPWGAAIERARARKREFDEIKAANEAAENLAKSLPLLQSIVPTKHTMINNALMNKMQKSPVMNEGDFLVPVANTRGKRDKEITSIAMLSYDPNKTGVKLTTKNMTEYERQVSDALMTLWLYGDESHVFTTDMIYRTMTGSTGKVTPAQAGAITKFMQKWEGVRVSIDASEEARIRKFTDDEGNPVDRFEVEENYINTRKISVRAGGKTVTAWQLLNEPIILQYCRMTNQFLTFNKKLLDIKELTSNGNVSDISLSNNENRIAIKGNLLRSILVMKRKKHDKVEWSEVISFDTLLKETSLDDLDKQAAKKIRDYIFSCLDFWKATGTIKGYRQKTQGRKITGVIIDL